VRNRQVLIKSKTRSPERVRESRAFQLTSDLHGCRSLAPNPVREPVAHHKDDLNCAFGC